MAKFAIPSFPFEKIEAISRLQRILICAGVFLILGGAFYFFVYMPQSQKLSELRDEYESLQTKLFTARETAKHLDEFTRKYEEAQIDFKVALQLLPDKKEIPSLLEGVSKSGTESGLDFLLFQPGAEIPRDFYSEIPVNIQVSGGYHNLAMFFSRVAHLSRIVNILNLSIQAPAGLPGILNASCVATTYRFLEAAAPPPGPR